MKCQSSNLVEQNFVRKAPLALRFQAAQRTSEIKFPENLGPYLKSMEPVMYELMSVVIFKPTVEHYVAVCREPCSVKWNRVK